MTDYRLEWLDLIYARMPMFVPMADWPRADMPMWPRGTLLDLKKFSDGTYRITRLGDESAEPESITFDNYVDCQNFVGWWYKPVAAQMDER